MKSHASFSPLWALPVVVLAAAHPLCAELVQALPLSALSLLCVAGCAWCWLIDREDLATAGMVLACLAVVLNPFYTWPVFFLLPRKESGASGKTRMWSWVGLALTSAFVWLWFLPDLHRIPIEGFERVRNASTLMVVSGKSAALPGNTPVLGLTAANESFLGVVAFLSALGIAILSWGRSESSSKSRLLTILAVLVMMPFLPNVVMEPHLGYGLSLVMAYAVVLVTLAYGVLSAFRRDGERPQWTRAMAGLLMASAGLAFFAHGVAERTGACWHFWSDDLKALEAAVTEVPLTRKRWKLVAAERDRGDQAAARRHAELYFKHYPNDQDRRVAYLRSLLSRDDTQEETLEVLKGVSRPLAAHQLTPVDYRALLQIAKDHSQRDLAFETFDCLEEPSEDELIVVAGLAKEAEDVQRIERVVERLQAIDKPSPAVAEHLYSHFSRKQEWKSLNALGERILAIREGDVLGHRALGRAAKIIRKDDDMVRHYEAVLAEDDSIPEVHFDLALVYHGRKGHAEQAARHYKRVLELIPKHPRRSLIESWVQQLSTVEGASK